MGCLGKAITPIITQVPSALVLEETRDSEGQVNRRQNAGKTEHGISFTFSKEEIRNTIVREFF